MKKQKKMFRNLFLLATVFAVFSVMYGCKQPDNGSAGTTEITVTVEKDNHVKEAPKNFKLAKNSVLGFTELKQKIPGLKFKTGYELGKICLEKASGREITDVSKHKFDKDTVIFIVSGKDIPVLKKLTVGAENKEGAAITYEMVFTIYDGSMEIPIILETEPVNAKTVFSPALTNGKLRLTGKETVLKITVGEKSKKSEYIVKVKKLATVNTLADTFGILGGRKKGISSGVTKEQSDKIIAGEKDVTIQLHGPNAVLVVGSKTQTWSDFKVNGKNFEFKSIPSYGLASICFADIKLPEKGQTADIKIEIESNDFKTEITFKIKRLNETADIPVETLIINNKNVVKPLSVLKNLSDGSKPEYDGLEPTNIEIQCSNDVIKSATIDGTVCEIKTKKDENNEDVWYAEHKVTDVKPSGKDITVIIEPKNTEDFHAVTWSFKLKYETPPTINVNYEINGKGKYYLDKTFIDGIEKNENPLIKIKGSFLNIKLIFSTKVLNFKINSDTVSGDTVKKEEDKYYLLHSIPIDTNEKQIEITINPLETSIYSPKIFRFRAKGNGNKELLTPYFAAIGDDENLSKSDFLDKLSDGSKPLYKTFGDSADLLIGISGYQYEFLCEEIKINNEKAEVQKTGNDIAIEKSIPVAAGIPTDVKIEFIAKQNKADNVVWEFKVQKGGKKPSIPQEEIDTFKINGIGSLLNPLPKELTEHLIDGTNPVYEFEGKKALIEIGCLYESIIEKVIFKIDGIKKAEIVPVKKGSGILGEYIAEYTFEITDTNEHPVELTILPKDTKYSELVYSFKLKSSGKNPPLPLIFGVNGEIKNSGYNGTINAEKVTLLVKANEDIMSEVTMGEKDTDEKTCTIKNKKNHWQAERRLSLPTDGNEKVFIIRVKPKDETKYRETVCKYTLKGIKIPNNNAEFIYTGGKDSEPKIKSKIEWVNAAFDNNEYINDYGAKAVTLTAYTLSPRASVKFQIVDMENKPIAGLSEKTMTNDDGIHTSEKITLFDDKPTRIKAWVIAEDGITENNKKGIWKTTYNPVPLAWGYEDRPNGADYKTRAYDVIEIEAARIMDNKIYLVFAPWKEADGYTVNNSGLPAYQTPFENLGKAGNSNTYYKTSIDVSTLLNNSATELEAVLKMKRNGTDCLTYKVKIKLKA